MPERSPSRPGSALVGTADVVDPTPELAREEDQDATPVDLFARNVAAVVAGTKKRRRPGLGVSAWLCIGWIVFVLVLALAAPFLPLADPNKHSKELIEASPSAAHWFGGDVNGRDLFARVAWGARQSLALAVVVVFFGLSIGGTIGLIGGYFRGRVESLVVALLDVMLAFPQLILALALVAFLGQSFTNLSLALVVVTIPILARITRANALIHAQREYVVAARAVGASHLRVLCREVTPNVLPALLSMALLTMAIVIVVEGGLSILGIGIKLPTASWGNIIAEGQESMRDAPNIVFFPAMFIFLTVLSLNYLGDVIRTKTEVRQAAL